MSMSKQLLLEQHELEAEVEAMREALACVRGGNARDVLARILGRIEAQLADTLVERRQWDDMLHTLVEQQQRGKEPAP